MSLIKRRFLNIIVVTIVATLFVGSFTARSFATSKTVKGVKIYSGWSNVKTIKTK